MDDFEAHVEIKRGQDRPQIGPKRQKKRALPLTESFFVSSCPPCGRKMLNCELVWGRFGIDVVLMLIHPRSLLGRSFCMSVCLSVCHADIQRPIPNRYHFQLCTSIISYRRNQDAQLKLHSSTLKLVFDWISRMFRIRCSNHNPGINDVQTNAIHMQAVPNTKPLTPTCK